ncbi:MAG: caspase family protein [Rubrivivax sp.]
MLRRVPAHLTPPGWAAGLLASALLWPTGGLRAQAPATAAPAVAAPALVFNLNSHSGPVRRLAVQPGAEHAVTVGDDKTALVWHLGRGTVERVLRVPVGDDEAGRLYGVAVSPDGRRVALGGSTGVAGGPARISLFDLASGRFEAAFDARGAHLRQLAFTPDGRALLASYIAQPGGGGAALRAFAVPASGAPGAVLFEQALPADAYGLSVSAQGQVAVAAFDGQVRCFQWTGTGLQAGLQFSTELRDPVGLRHSPDGRHLAVGYFSRQGGGRTRVDVYQADNGQRARAFEFDDVRYGNLMTVGWLADGSALFAGGTGYTEAGQFAVKRMAWPTGTVDSGTVAGDSLLDFAALPGGRLAFAGFDATWGVLQGLQTVQRSAAPVARPGVAAGLLVSDDARQVQWRTAEGQTLSFALAERRLGTGEARARRAPQPSATFGLRVVDWENHRQPQVAGQKLALLANETSRAAALLPDGGSVLMGTSRALRRVGAQGQMLWTVPLNTEARAVNVSADGQVLVAALADGSLRWRRTADGAPLLSLLPLRDGRWVLWTEAGHFDASPGAEDLVGWLVTRPGGAQADYFGASRFREQYLRPDVIDQVLPQRDAARALAQVNQQRLQAATAAAAEPEVLKSLQSQMAPVALLQALPPVVTLAELPPPLPNATELAISFKLFNPSGQKVDKVTVRVDGRPVEVAVQQGPAGPGGETEGRMVVPLPKAEGKIQIFAEGLNGTSMPAELNFKSQAPALKALGERRPTLYLLAVGVSRYANPEMNLGLAAKDARDFAAAMRRQAGLYYKQVEVRLLQDDQATRANVLQGLRWLQNVAGPDDVAMLFLAGHGVADAADIYHFLPHDMREQQLGQTAVSETQLRSTLASIKGRALFFVDTCFSGKSVGKFSKRELTRMANGMASAEMGVIVFSGSAPRQESLEDPAWGNGAFTRALVAGLAGQADFRREGVVTHKGLDYYVAHEVRSLTQGRQTPVTAVPNGIADFPLAAVSATPQQNKPGVSP